jgi:hypothetical protein
MSSFSQSNVHSLNIVGYYQRALVPGFNLIANQLDGSTNNSLNSILLGVADGATFTKWDSAANTFLTPSVFNQTTLTWSINYSLNLGEGALLNSPALTTNVFVGQVAIYTNILIDLGPGQLWAPNYADGLHLIACPDPISGPISSMFANVVGRTPETGEWVQILDEATQAYITATFDGSSWDNNPTLAVGHSAWFNLGPVAASVPEPSSLALVGVATFSMLITRRRRS